MRKEVFFPENKHLLCMNHRSVIWLFDLTYTQSSRLSGSLGTYATKYLNL